MRLFVVSMAERGHPNIVCRPVVVAKDDEEAMRQAAALFPHMQALHSEEVDSL